jgi:predicted TIM-barrel fold metal-dependent hydrolase
VIDCDVHNTWQTVEELRPFIDPAFRDWFDHGEVPGSRPAFPAAHRAWLHPEDFRRLDAISRNGGGAGSDFELMCGQLLDRYEIDYAVLTGDEPIEVSTLANPYYAQALASAYNDYLVEVWLARDPRLKGSLVVAPQAPAQAAAEIRRLGSHPDIVQVLVSSGAQRPYGDPVYHPIWEACAELDLPLAVHLGGNGGINANPTGCGPPTFFWEAHALLCETGMGHLASAIAHGVFERWPNARLVLIECGIAWVPALLWRLDEDYRALRKETPWLRRLPSEYAHDHVRLTTQPLEQPRERTALWPSLADIGAQDMLLYASDYPHWDFDDPRLLRLPETWRESVFDANARRLYGLPPHEEPAGEGLVAGGQAG